MRRYIWKLRLVGGQGTVRTINVDAEFGVKPGPVGVRVYVGSIGGVKI